MAWTLPPTRMRRGVRGGSGDERGREVRADDGAGGQVARHDGQAEAVEEERGGARGHHGDGEVLQEMPGGFHAG